MQKKIENDVMELCLLIYIIYILDMLGYKTEKMGYRNMGYRNIGYRSPVTNSSQVSKIFFFQLVKGSLLRSPWLGQILTSIKGRNSVANLPKYDALQSQRRSCQ